AAPPAGAASVAIRDTLRWAPRAPLGIVDIPITQNVPVQPRRRPHRPPRALRAQDRDRLGPNSAAAAHLTAMLSSKPRMARRKPGGTYNSCASRGAGRHPGGALLPRPGDRHAQPPARHHADPRCRAQRSAPVSGLVAPLGGTLVDARAAEAEAAELARRAEQLPAVEMSLA